MPAATLGSPDPLPPGAAGLYDFQQFVRDGRMEVGVNPTRPRHCERSRVRPEGRTHSAAL